MSRRIALVIFFLGLAGFPAAASPGENFRIARVSYLEGHVSFQRANEVDWTAASINMPLQADDRIYTGDDGRAEIEFDDGSVFRLAERTDVEILAMRENFIQLRVLLGLCTLTADSSVEFEVNTPAAAFTTLREGSYRFDVRENGDSDAIVRKGLLDAANDRFSRRIEVGELLHVTPGEQGTELLSRYEQVDEWDEWNDRRNADLHAYESRRYLPDYVAVGVSDLDRYGRWVSVDVYGPAWVPVVGPGWSPYWDGRWCYRPHWGWTWVSYEPWGWLPYHYGRWYHSVSFGWCWLPGPSFGFHFWSPGLVRFYRGPSWVSWCPLGPGDYYNVNHYFYNRTYNYYVNNMRLIQRRGPEDLVNRGAPHAFRTATTAQFANSALGGRGRMEELRAGNDIVRSGRMVTGNLDVAPTPLSYSPAPQRSASNPGIRKQLPAVVRTMPEGRRGDANGLRQIRNAGGAPAGALRNSIQSAPVVRTPGRTSEEPSRGAIGGRNPGTAVRTWNRVDPDSSDSRGGTAGRVLETPRPQMEAPRSSRGVARATEQPAPPGRGVSRVPMPQTAPGASDGSRGAIPGAGRSNPIQDRSPSVPNARQDGRPQPRIETRPPATAAPRTAPTPRTDSSRPQSPPEVKRPETRPQPTRPPSTSGYFGRSTGSGSADSRSYPGSWSAASRGSSGSSRSYSGSWTTPSRGSSAGARPSYGSRGTPAGSQWNRPSGIRQAAPSPSGSFSRSRSFPSGTAGSIFRSGQASRGSVSRSVPQRAPSSRGGSRGSSGSRPRRP